MRRIIALAALATLLALAALWWTGGFNALAHWAAGQQRGFQNSIASGLRATRGGDMAAFWTVLLASFAYGVVHAAGPGHGKIVIGGYGLARAVPMLGLSQIALAASLGQAVMAVVPSLIPLWSRRHASPCRSMRDAVADQNNLITTTPHTLRTDDGK